MNVSRRYNLVEVILALGVVAIGVVSIMALFPIGANASRDASMETYAANVSDEMLQFVKYRLKLVEDKDNEQDNIDKRWEDLVGKTSTTGAITEDKPTKTKLDVEVAKLDDTGVWKTPDIDIFGDIFESTHTIYQHDTDKQVFQLLSHRNSDDVKLGDTDSDPKKDFATNVDFRAIAYIWKEQIIIDQTQASDSKVSYESGARIIIRVTWPAELPYDARQKADYVLEIFKPIIQE
ncbi:MAG: hypothetical protein J6X49_01675 [Victivallales bacterium]|nr:hypothetical protein [Victivallales bacterium]